MSPQEIQGLGGKLSRFLSQFRSFIRSIKSRHHLATYVTGQVSDLERKSVEPMADRAGVEPRNLQEFLSLHRWDEDGVRDKIQQIATRKYASDENIGIIDETSFPKKGTETVGVQRQYCGASGKVDNCVVSIHLAFASGDFHTLIDSDLFLPEVWLKDRSRRKKVGIPDDVEYRTYVEIALTQIEHALENKVPLHWITADERYGRDPAFLAGLEKLGLSYVIEVPRSATGWPACPTVWKTPEEAGDALGQKQIFPRIADTARKAKSVKEIAATSRRMRDQPWEAFRIKDTEKGPEVWEAKTCTFYQNRNDLPSEKLTLLIARNVLHPSEIKYFLVNASEDASIETILRIAFSRFTVERCFKEHKGQVGMDHFEVRKYISVKRHLIVSMLSILFLREQTLRLKKKTSSLDDLPSQECCGYLPGHTGSDTPGSSSAA